VRRNPSASTRVDDQGADLSSSVVLRVTQSNRLEELAAAIDESLPQGDPFARPTVVVSSRLVGRWLQYALARRRGIAGNLELPFLEPFLERAFTADTAGALRGLDRAKLGALVASSLADGALLEEPVMAPARGYLLADGADAADVRRVQLAERVAAHLWDYALTRPDWLDAWDDGREADTGEVDPATLAWQRRIYGAIFAERPAEVLVPRLPRARRRLGLGQPSLPGPVHVVGFSYLAQAHVEALQALGAAGEVHVAMTTPCAEYWEDVPGRRAKGSIEEPLALVYWGLPGRDTTSMLLNATEGNVEERHVEPEASTALAAWARDVLHRAPCGGPAGEPGVTVLACPSISRELEIVGSEIWRALREDASLRATDIAVLVAGDASAHARYLAQVGPVLGSLHGLPFHVVDAPAATSGRVAEAALELLALPLGRFTRREMLSLMTHPAVLARHPHVDPADWAQWCERLGIAHGADGADHAGTYL
jgi:exodeoxyribonuclease V gamma subunit